MEYNKIISSAEAEYKLKPGVLKRLIEVESSGNANAIGPKTKSGERAIGLGQLMPKTAKELGVTDPSDPTQNIYGAAKYLRKNLDKFNGDYGQAIAGYNAGPNNRAVVEKNWKLLPTETKNYTQKFLDFILSPASADETPYKEPSIAPVDNANQQSVNPPADNKVPASDSSIVWDDQQTVQSQPTEVSNTASSIVWDDQQTVEVQPTNAISSEPEQPSDSSFSGWVKNQLDFSHGKSIDQVRQEIRDSNTPESAGKKIETAVGAMMPGKFFNTIPKAIGTSALIGASQGDTAEEKLINSAIGGVLGGAIGVGGKAVERYMPNIQYTKLADQALEKMKGILPEAWETGIKGVGNNLDEIAKTGHGLVGIDRAAPKTINSAADQALPIVNGKLPKYPQVQLSNTKAAVEDLVKNRTSGISRIPDAQAKSDLLDLSKGIGRAKSSFEDATQTYEAVNEKIRSLKTEGKDYMHWVKIKKGIEKDIESFGTANNRPEVYEAWKTGNDNFRKLRAFEDLNDIYKKNLNPVNGETRLNMKQFNKDVKNWNLKNEHSLTSEEAQTLKDFGLEVSKHENAMKYGAGHKTPTLSGDILKSLPITSPFAAVGLWKYVNNKPQ
jgi:hypothetical protein